MRIYVWRSRWQSGLRILSFVFALTALSAFSFGSDRASATLFMLAWATIWLGSGV